MLFKHMFFNVPHSIPQNVISNNKSTCGRPNVLYSLRSRSCFCLCAPTSWGRLQRHCCAAHRFILKGFTDLLNRSPFGRYHSYYLLANIGSRWAKGVDFAEYTSNSHFSRREGSETLPYIRQYGSYAFDIQINRPKK